MYTNFQAQSVSYYFGTEGTIGNVREDLNKAAGISIYRDGFRVMPYGEAQNDWLRLDLRRVQNPTLRLSNNQILGYILISADTNPNLLDQSNREGLMESPALSDLQELVTNVLAILEARRYGLRPRRETPAQQQLGIFSGFNLTAVQSLVKRKYSDDSELLALIGEKEQDLEMRIEQVQEVLARYRRLATLGQLIDTVLHDGRTPVAKIGNEAEIGLRDINRTQNDCTQLIQTLQKRLKAISEQSDVLTTVFRRIEPFGGRKRGRPDRVTLEQVIADAFSVLNTEIKERGARISLPQTVTWVTVDQAEIQEVIVNLLQNSLYWLRDVPKDTREIEVRVNRINADEVEILFSDSGPGVKSEARDRIFEPYFSTKPDGVGLGLTIAGEIVNEYYGGTMELIQSSHIPGATFRIILRKRVQE